jgi:hypothetical protein
MLRAQYALLELQHFQVHRFGERVLLLVRVDHRQIANGEQRGGIFFSKPGPLCVQNRVVEPRLRHRVGIHAPLDQFDGDALLELPVGAHPQINHRHAAPSDFTLNPVRAHSAARRVVGDDVGGGCLQGLAETWSPRPCRTGPAIRPRHAISDRRRTAHRENVRA